jgi:hypothetical protein
MEEWIMGARAMIQSQLNEIYENAKDLGNRYLQEVMDTNKHKDWNHKNTLQFRVRLSDNSNALSLEWYAVAWQGKKETGRKKKWTYIPKRNKSRRRDARVYSYYMEDLLRHAVGWDENLVTEVEVEASLYRRQAHYLSDMLVTLGRLERFTTGSIEESLPEEEQ